MIAGLIDAADRGDLSTVRLALDGGANANMANASGKTAIMLPSYKGHHDVVLTLLAADANVIAVTKDGQSALSHASEEPVVQALLEAGPSINATNAYGGTSLSWAAYYGHESVVQVFLDSRADMNVANNAGDTVV